MARKLAPQRATRVVLLIVMLWVLVGCVAVPPAGAPGARVPAAGASLRLDPAGGTVEAGAIFTVDILFDTGTGPADTIDAYINFDPAFLEVVDSSGQPVTSIWAVRASTGESKAPSAAWNVPT